MKMVREVIQPLMSYLRMWALTPSNTNQEVNSKNEIQITLPGSSIWSKNYYLLNRLKFNMLKEIKIAICNQHIKK